MRLFTQKSLAHRLSATHHAHPQPQARPSMRTWLLTHPVTHNGKVFVVTQCSDSDTGPPPHTVASGTLACKLAVTFLAYWLPTTSSTDCQQPASTLSLTNEPVTAHQSKQQPVHHVSLGSKRESVPQHQYAPHARQHAAGPSQANNKQPASMRTCSPALSPIMGRRLSSRNAQTVTPGRHRNHLPVTPWLTRLQPALPLPTRLIMPDSSSPHTAKQTTTPMPSTGPQMPESSGSNEVDCLNNQPAGSQARLPCHP